MTTLPLAIPENPSSFEIMSTLVLILPVLGEDDNDAQGEVKLSCLS